MTGKKMRALLLAGMAVLFAGSSFVNYNSAKQFEAKENVSHKDAVNNITAGITSSIAESSVDTYSPKDVMAWINEEQYNYSYGAVIFDQDGNVVETNGMTFQFYEDTGDGGWNESCYNVSYEDIADCKVEIEGTEVSNSASEYQKMVNFMENDYVANEGFSDMELSYNLDGDKLEPVSLRVEDEENQTSMLVTFSDEKAQYNITNTCFAVEGDAVDEDGDVVDESEVQLQNLSFTWYNSSTIDVDKCVANQKALIKEQEDGTAYLDIVIDENSYSDLIVYGTDTGAMTNDGAWEVTCNWKYKGETYTLAVGEAAPTTADILTCDHFRVAEIMQAIFYVVIYVVLCFILTRLLKRNQRLDHSRKAFISAAGHELKTPIAIIQNQCECLIEDVNPAKNKEYAKSIYEETDRMNHLVVTMLQYNKVMATDKVTKESFSLSQLLNEQIDKYRPLFAEKQIALNTEGIESYSYFGNEELLALAIDNLLSNAAKYTPPQGAVTVSLKSAGKKAELTMENTCDGLSEEQLEDIWEPLYRTDQSRTGDGSSTGMGLPITAEILKLHKAKYHAQNTSTGLAFTVIL